MSRIETRKKIIDCAEILFANDGYKGVTTKQIAKESGITEMTLFNHFSSKELLYKTVVKENYLATEIVSKFPELTYKDLEKDLTIITEHLLNQYYKNRYILMMRLKEKNTFNEDESFTIENDPILIQITPMFFVYEKSGYLKSDAKSTALLYVTTLKGIFYVNIINEFSDKNMSKLIEQFVKTFCYGQLNI